MDTEALRRWARRLCQYIGVVFVMIGVASWAMVTLRFVSSADNLLVIAVELLISIAASACAISLKT